MKDIQLLAENVIKLEDIKQEPDIDMELPVWDSTELDEFSTADNIVKKEGEEEIGFPDSVFLEPNEIMNEEGVEELKDPLAMCSGGSMAPVKKEENQCSTGEEGVAVRASRESLAPVECADGQSICACSNHGSSEGKGSAPTLPIPGAKLNESAVCKKDSTAKTLKSSSRVPMRYTCGICKKSYSARSNLKTHIKTHKGHINECSICQKRLATKDGLVRHMRSHTGERPYECSVCKSKFSERRTLDLHMRGHTGQRPYECSECHNRFIRKEHLIAHIKSHARERPHECSICHKGFSRKDHLVVHVRSHTGERPYECSVCEKKFLDKGSLVRHTRAHSGERRYECSACHKRFSRKADLVVHIRIHTGQKPYECSFCRKRFSHQGNFVGHMRVHTG